MNMPKLLENTRRYLEIVNKQPSLHTMTPKEIRKLRAKAPKMTLSKPVNLSKVEDCFISARDGEEIQIRIYTPIGEGPFPIHIYYHGGGWVLNDIETCDSTCQLLAVETNSIVISVGYRLAPEYKFPTPVNDAYDAFIWTVENAQFINGLQDKISVMGDSAGGNLATVVTLINKEQVGPSIASQILLYPVVDLSYDTISYFEFAEGFGLEKKDMEWFGQHYLSNEKERCHPYVAPLNHKDLYDLPPALIIVVENDVLRDEGISYAKRLIENGNYVKKHVAKGLVHSYFTKNDVFSESIADTIKIIRSFLEKI